MLACRLRPQDFGGERDIEYAERIWVQHLGLSSDPLVPSTSCNLISIAIHSDGANPSNGVVVGAFVVSCLGGQDTQTKNHGPPALLWAALA